MSVGAARRRNLAATAVGAHEPPFRNDQLAHRLGVTDGETVLLSGLACTITTGQDACMAH